MLLHLICILGVVGASAARKCTSGIADGGAGKMCNGAGGSCGPITGNYCYSNAKSEPACQIACEAESTCAYYSYSTSNGGCRLAKTWDKSTTADKTAGLCASGANGTGNVYKLTCVAPATCGDKNGATAGKTAVSDTECGTGFIYKTSAATATCATAACNVPGTSADKSACCNGIVKLAEACADKAECASDVCTKQKCAKGIVALAGVCADKAECASDVCTAKKCAKGIVKLDGVCADKAECALDVCTANKCTKVGLTGVCALKTDCVSGICTDKKCAKGTVALAGVCADKAECASDVCTASKCAKGIVALAGVCANKAECASGLCTELKCAEAKTKDELAQASKLAVSAMAMVVAALSSATFV